MSIDVILIGNKQEVDYFSNSNNLERRNNKLYDAEGVSYVYVNNIRNRLCGVHGPELSSQGVKKIGVKRIIALRYLTLDDIAYIKARGFADKHITYK